MTGKRAIPRAKRARRHCRAAKGAAADQGAEPLADLTSRNSAAWAVREPDLARSHDRRPGPSVPVVDASTTAAGRVHDGSICLLRESGPGGLLRAINDGIHELAREGSRNPLNPWLRERLGQAPVSVRVPMVMDPSLRSTAGTSAVYDRPRRSLPINRCCR